MIGNAIRETRNYTDQIEISDNHPAALERRKAIVHVLDHVLRMTHRCTQEERLALLREDDQLAPLAAELRELICELMSDPEADGLQDRLDKFRQRMRDLRHVIREETISLTAQRKMNSTTALVRLDAVRWLHRVAYHVWRVAVHLPELKSVNTA
jgi:phosphate:Na+ symporter